MEKLPGLRKPGVFLPSSQGNDNSLCLLPNTSSLRTLLFFLKTHFNIISLFPPCLCGKNYTRIPTYFTVSLRKSASILLQWTYLTWYSRYLFQYPALLSGLFLSFCLSTLCTYSLIVYSELITFLCINLMWFIYLLWSQTVIICIIVVTHSVLCMLLSIDKFHTHFGGSLEY